MFTVTIWSGSDGCCFGLVLTLTLLGRPLIGDFFAENDVAVASMDSFIWFYFLVTVCWNLFRTFTSLEVPIV